MAEDFRRDATDKMTFGEMLETDVDNLTLVTKKCKEYVFDSLQDALKWTNETMQQIFLKFGIDKNKIIADALRMPLDSVVIRSIEKECIAMKGQVDPRKLLACKNLDKRMADADLHQEDRKYENRKDAWRTGHYFYHHNEIAYFISAPYRRKGGHYQTPHIVVPAFGKWFIQSNYNEGIKLAS